MTLLTPNEIYIDNSDNFNVTVKVFTDTNQIPTSPTFLGISLYNNLDVLNDLPMQLASFVGPQNISSDSNGIVTFKNCYVFLLGKFTFISLNMVFKVHIT